jgi:2-polyprenyl-3-methyl-5-hydroxy-6-metoxy-1,4-benzoquinol methylase
MAADQYWIDYFDQLHTQGPVWIDYSNERVQLETLGAVLGASNSLSERRVLDIGSGRGQLCLLAKSLGASVVTGVDLAASAVEGLRRAHPEIDWRAGDITDPEFRHGLGTYDVIFAVESLQYLPIPTALDWLYDALAPGGRFVAMFPNDSCPIVTRTRDRFEGRYVPPSFSAVTEWASTVPELEWAVRGLWFQQDQRITAYESSPWTSKPTWPVPPNRIQLVFQKPSEPLTQ